MSQSYTNLLYHIIFSTKDRQPLISSEYQTRLYDYIGGTIRGAGGISLGINGTEDHVHLLAKLRPDKALSGVLRDLKANHHAKISFRDEFLQFLKANGIEYDERYV